MATKKKKSQLSDKELANWFDLYFNTWDVIGNAIITLNRRKLTPGVTTRELNQIEVDLLWLQSEHAKLKKRRAAFQAGRVAIMPPTDPQVKKVKKLVDETEKLKNSAAAARKGVNLTKSALSTINDVLPEPA